MEDLLNAQFRTFTKVITDIVAGGNLIWTTYYDKFSFKDQGVVDLVRVEDGGSGITLVKETCLMTGVYRKPSAGYYYVEIEFRNENHERLKIYCGQLVGHDKLICQVIINSKFSNKNPYESEIFTRMEITSV